MKTMSSMKRMLGNIIKSSSKKKTDLVEEEEAKSSPNSLSVVSQVEISSSPQVSSRTNIFIDIFHDAENCQLRNSTNGSKLYDLVIDQVMKTSFPDFDTSKGSHQVAINWRLVLPFQASMGTVISSSSRTSSHQQLSSSSSTYQTVDTDSSSNYPKESFQKLRQCIRVLQTRRVIHVNPGDKKGAVDIVIKDMLENFCSTHSDDSEEKKRNRVIVLLSSDRDFASNIRSLQQKGFSVILIYNNDVISSSFLDVLPEGKAIGIWKTLIAQTEPSTTSTTAASPSQTINSAIESSSSSSSSSSSNRTGMMYEAQSRIPPPSSQSSSQPSRSGGSLSNVSVSGGYSGTNSRSGGGSVSGRRSASAQRRNNRSKNNFDNNTTATDDVAHSQNVSRQLFVDSLSSSPSSLSSKLVVAVVGNDDSRSIIAASSVSTTSDKDMSTKPAASVIYSPTYISNLSNCAVELYLILCRSPGYCMDTTSLNRFMSTYPVGSIGKIVDFISRSESGDLFAWHRCWFPALHSYTSNNISRYNNEDNVDLSKAMTTVTRIQEGSMILQLRHQPPSLYLIEALVQKYPRFLSPSLSAYIASRQTDSVSTNNITTSSSNQSIELMPSTITGKGVKSSNSSDGTRGLDKRVIWYNDKTVLFAFVLILFIVLIGVAVVVTNPTVLTTPGLPAHNEAINSVVTISTQALKLLITFYFSFDQCVKHHWSLLLFQLSSLPLSSSLLTVHTTIITDLFSTLHLSNIMNSTNAYIQSVVATIPNKV